MSTKSKYHRVQRTYLVDLDYHTFPIFSDSLDDIFFFIVNGLCVANSVLSGENSADDKEKYRTDDEACAADSPWDVVTA